MWAIKILLEKHKELSIRLLAIKTKSQWRTIEKALETMKSLDVVKERDGENSVRILPINKMREGGFEPPKALSHKMTYILFSYFLL